MEFDITDFRIVDRPASLLLRDDPAQRFAIRCQGVAYAVVTADMDIDSIEIPGLNVVMEGETTDCILRCLDVDGHALVVCIPYSDDETPDGTAYLYVRAGQSYSPWQAATKMLVLPFSTPWEWGRGDADVALRQQNGRVLAYVALATLNNWFLSDK